MTTTFDALQTRRADRADAVRMTISDSFLPVEMDFSADHGPAAARGAVTDLGDLTILSVTSSAVEVRRTAALTHDDYRPSIVLGLQMAGSCVVAQHGRQVLLRPNDLVVYESMTPWVISDGDGIRQHKFRIPLDRLSLPPDAVRQVCAVKLAPGHPIADLASAYFRRLAARPGMYDRPGGAVVSQPSIELLRAVITTHLDAAELGGEALHAAQFVRIMEYVRSHLREPDLSAGRIAAEHHISVRQLYRILADGGISLGDWIRVRRLEECRKELASNGFGDPIAAVARRWGFTDASSFARMFRAEFGTSPRDWRELNRRSGRAAS